MRRFLLLLALLLLAGCSGAESDSGPADPNDLALVKLSGDGQTAPVRSSPPASGGLVSYAVTDNPDLLPEPLVAKIVIESGGSMSLMPTGPSYSLSAPPPSFAQIPAGTVVTFRVTEEECGASFITSDVPDDSALVSTFWEKGTVAGTVCQMEARIVVDDVPQVAETFTATFEPGPPVGWNGTLATPVSVGDTISIDTLTLSGRDAYQNELGTDDLSDGALHWMWAELVPNGIRNAPESPPAKAQAGWSVTVPAEAAGWGECSPYNATLLGWVDGVKGGVLFCVAG